MSPERSFRRVLAIASKETLHVRRDPRSLYMALGMPLVMILLFGFGVSFDREAVPLAIVDQDRSAASRQLTETMTAANEFEVVARVDAAPEAEALFRKGEAEAALVIPAGFAEKLGRGDGASAQLLADGSDPSGAQTALSRADALMGETRSPRRVSPHVEEVPNAGMPIWAGFAAPLTRAAGAGEPGTEFGHEALVQAAGAGRGLQPTAAPPIEARVWTRFNPTQLSAWFLVPGLVALILSMVTVMLTSLTIAREWERGSMEQLFATPVGRFEIILGKLLPYLGVGILQLLLVLFASRVVFHVPMRGSPLLLGLLSLLFLIGMLGQGLLLSIVTKSQMLATQAGIMTTMLPSMLLSGFMYPIENMPRPLQLIAAAIPARYYIDGLRGVLLKGNGIAELWPETLSLALFAVFMLCAASAKFVRRLA